jgi:hypothetical protein
VVSSGPQLVPPPQPRERNWLPLAIAACVVVVVAAAAFFLLEHGKHTNTVTPISAATDPYAQNLVLSNLAMSESANLAGGKVTYLDGHIVNKGSKTVTGVSVQVLFRTFAREVAQNETQSMKLIRMRTPYIDVEPLSAAPLAPGAEGDFRLIFDTVTPDWDTAIPELRILKVDTK